MSALFLEHTKMADLVLTNRGLLYVLPCFGIELGFGEKTVGQVCAERSISAPLLSLVCNLYTFENYTPDQEELGQIPIEGIVAYLQASHRNYLQVRMPRIIDAVLGLPGGEMLASFCEKYRQEAVAHFKYEEEVVFPYIGKLLNGEKPAYKISEYESKHSDIDGALEDLKNIIVKYLPKACTIDKSHPVLLELFAFEYDLRKHALLEETILIPLVERLDSERQVASDGMELTAREQEVLAELARGFSNKEVADKLYISTHTVISHRKNIMRKTGFKTAQGLTFYALHNGLISQDDFR
ncbi:MAG: LuxR C-terminal-related transcriptional regulator [Culturomica sp.]|jgi:regulator of cell morphogenesis and NO signaling|nr:LuxR C-terminal-related transcriptional regulator [Culturomica sp.]